MRTTMLAISLLLTAPLGPAFADTGHGNHAAMADGVHTTEVVNAMSDTSVNVSHDPIPEIGWPAMTMDLSILDGADTGDVAVGDDVTIMLEKGPDGLYGVRALERAE
ncbi:MAG: copper-binding protein [Devosia sp.]